MIAINNCVMTCTMGLAPSPIFVLPQGIGLTNISMPIATIFDSVPFFDIKPFGMCKSPSNPAVAAIIAASLGSVTQGPCIPCTTSPWIPGYPIVIINGEPLLTINSKLICMFGGIISVAPIIMTTIE